MGKLVAVVLVVVLVGLVAGGAFWYLRTHAGPAPVGPLPGQALVLPADTVLLAGLDVKALVASATYRHLAAGDIPSLGQALPPEEAEAAKKELREGIQKGLREVEEKVGLRLDRDLDRVVLAASDVEASEPGYALLAWGRFDQAKLVGAVKASAEAEGGTLTASTVEGTAVHVASEKGKAVAALAFLDDATLVAGQAGVVEAIVRSQARRERPLESSPSLIALVGGLDPASGYWAAADRPLVDRMQKEAGEAPVAAPLPRTLTLAGTFDGGLELAGEMADATAAKDLADLLQGGLAALRMQLRQRAELRAVPGATALLDGVLVKAEGAKVTLSAPGGGGGAGLAGVAGAIAVPSLLRARSSANESAAIGDLRTVISAQAAYQSANGGFYGEMACLAQPKLCIVGYEGPHFLDPELASATERSGYRRAFHPGPPAGTPRSLAGYAYTAVPAQPGQTGLRSFCGDASGMICFDPTGADVVPENGACPSTCVALQ